MKKTYKHVRTGAEIPEVVFMSIWQLVFCEHVKYFLGEWKRYDRSNIWITRYLLGSIPAIDPMLDECENNS